jgi:hypothetical protein
LNLFRDKWQKNYKKSSVRSKAIPLEPLIKRKLFLKLIFCRYLEKSSNVSKKKKRSFLTRAA